MKINIRFIDKETLPLIIPLLQKLNTKIPAPKLRPRLQEMIALGYQCVGVFDEEKLIGISGLWILAKYYIGKHVEMDNVYIEHDYRSKGVGKKLVDWVDHYAKSIGCVGAELNCYMKNIGGQKFWEKCGYKKLGYHYQKKYDPDSGESGKG